MQVPVRSAALVLVLSLVSPAVATAVCELTCLRAQHHDAGPATETDCHARSDSPAGTVSMSAAADVLCHDEAVMTTAVIAGSKQPGSMPGILHVPQRSSTDVRGLLNSPGGSWFRPPNRLSIATQLRI